MLGKVDFQIKIAVATIHYINHICTPIFFLSTKAIHPNLPFTFGAYYCNKLPFIIC